MAKKWKVTIFKTIEGNEDLLEEEIARFLNSKPIKSNLTIHYSNMGINHYVMILYQIGIPQTSTSLPEDEVMKKALTKKTYDY